MTTQIAVYENWKREEERRQQAGQELTKPAAARAGGARQPPPIDVNELRRRLTEDMPARAEDEVKDDPDKRS
jgi:hypothetical protein